MRMMARLFLMIAVLAATGNGRESGKSTQSIEQFNRKFRENILKMDNAAMLKMWADNGIDLMPGESPLLGKKAIAAWLKEIETRGAGSQVSKEELEFHDLQVSRDWASEWANETQVIQAPGKPAVVGYGKIALVLHREADGQWQIRQEMWNDSPHP